MSEEGNAEEAGGGAKVAEGDNAGGGRGDTAGADGTKGAGCHAPCVTRFNSDIFPLSNLPHQPIRTNRSEPNRTDSNYHYTYPIGS